ncbi:glycosyl transferase family 1 [Mangrovihabitans endophyticus]|uniref:Glycosyl transferase family 1 n=2 Tax=Mangrovihabitans endophyticus TaxID=1751298 RepID=A0A8J3C5U6_9ACTN|nr:glycosyl transferase family 1 [Mangrovihabitans endophyticus]
MLSGSETFVRNHGRHLTRWTPEYLGAIRVDSPLSDVDDVIAFPDGGFLPLRLTGRSAALRALLRELRPDVVHAHFAGDGYLISHAAAGTPLVVTVHGHDVTRQPAAPGPRGLRYRRNLRTVFRRADLILAVSSFIADRAIACGADPAKVRVHHTGVPLPAAPAPDSGTDTDVLFVGRFIDKKGVTDLAAALSTMPGVRAAFLGSGPLEAAIRRRLPHAVFPGAQPSSVVAEWMARAKVLAAPSRTAADGDTEGLPTTVVEAMALGRPVVATRHSGIPEAVVHGSTGLLGPERDPDTLAANLRDLLADDGLRERMGKQARAYAEEHFDLRRQSARLEDLYDGLAG